MGRKPRKDPAAVALGRKGGRAKNAKLSAEERSASAKLAASKRWSGKSTAERKAHAEKMRAAKRKRT